MDVYPELCLISQSLIEVTFNVFDTYRLSLQSSQIVPFIAK